MIEIRFFNLSYLSNHFDVRIDNFSLDLWFGCVCNYELKFPGRRGSFWPVSKQRFVSKEDEKWEGEKESEREGEEEREREREREEERERDRERERQREREEVRIKEIGYITN